MTPYERSAVVEAGRFFSLLFLNNNLHYVHHKRPDLPWHALPRYWREHRRELLAENGGLLYRGGYLEILRRFWLRPVDEPVHPHHCTRPTALRQGPRRPVCDLGYVITVSCVDIHEII